MAHDYKHHAQPRGPAPIPAWVWLFAFTAITSFAGLLYYLDLYDKGQIGMDHKQNLKQIFSQQQSQQQLSQQQKSVEKAKPKKQESVAKKTTEFNFYDLLPSMEVMIPDREIAVNDSEVPRRADEQSSVSYILQAGSFREVEQADRLKAGLALIGVESTIEPVINRSTGTWYRVRVGPFGNMREIDKVRNRMRANNIEPILLRDKS